MKLNAGPAQWVGIAIMVVACGLTVFVAPRVAGDVVPRQNSADEVTAVDEGTRIFEGDVSVVPGKGWSQAEGIPGSLLILRRASTDFAVAVPSDALKLDPQGFVENSVEAYKTDKSAAYDVGEPESFTTTSGLPGVKAVVIAPDTVSLTVGIGDESQLSTVTVSTSPDDWARVQGDIQPMLESIEFGAEGGATSDTSTSDTGEK